MKKNLFAIILMAISLISCTDNSSKSSITTLNLNEGWQFSQSDQDSWLPAKVPGSIQSDLLINNIIEDPFYRLNEHDVQWVDKKDWVYKRDITITKEQLKSEHIELQFEGVDTYSDISINGEKVASTTNMFRTWNIDAKQYLKEGDNELKVYLHSPIKVGIKLYDNYPHEVQSSGNDLAEIGQVPGDKRVSPHLRKAGYHFGWDWGPRVVPSGIWKPVTLKIWNGASLSDLRIVQNSVDTELAKLTAEFEIKAENDEEAKLKIAIDANSIIESTVQLTKGVNIYKVDFEVNNPKLWWTNGLGEANLYPMTGTLETADGTTSISHNIGLRNLELIREEDSIGKSFYFKLNGEPVFMKGANYIPNDILLDRVTPEMYEDVIMRAKSNHMNMLRVWGGGIYEKDIFYDLCDKHGIIVWQDFMFACNMYPGDPAYLENVKHEAIDNIKRLRNHPSIGIWCGNNEILGAWFGWGWKQENEEKDPKGAAAMWKAYKDIFLDVLPKAVTAYDPQRFYWSSSPQSGELEKENLTHGDSHYWSVWGGASAPFETYRDNISRFMSEYGFQAFPDISSIKRYTVEEDWDIYSEVMKSHQRSYVGNKQIDTYLERDYRKPKDFESFIYVGQLLQAEGITLAMESHRVAMPRNMGTLYWQLNDCWPGASWSGIDYYGKWKALQYFIKKNYKESIVVPRIEDDNMAVYVVTDRLTDFDATLDLEVIDFNGKSIWKESKKVTIDSNNSKIYASKTIKELLSGKRDNKVLLVAKLSEGGKELSRKVRYFTPLKNIDFPNVDVISEITKDNNRVVVKLKSDKLAKNVYINVENYQGNYSDNFIDLIPGEERTITFDSEMTLESIKNSIKIRTLSDTY